MKKFNKIMFIVLSFFMVVNLTACDFGGLGQLIEDIQNSIKYDDKITNISVSGPNTVEVGKTINLQATVSPLTSNQSVSWESLNRAIAQVDSNGNVTGVNPGKATIRVTSNKSSVYKDVVVVVTESLVEPTNIKINGPSQVYVGSKNTYQIQTTPEVANHTVTWSSSDEEVATISYTGELKALKIGTVIITAKYNDNISDQFQVTIVSKTENPQKISLKGYSEIFVDEVATIEYSILPTDAIDLLTWSSNDETICTVDASGRVKGCSVGKATITAKSTIDASVYATFNIEVLNKPSFENNNMSLQDTIKTVINYNKKSVFGVVNYQYNSLTGANEKKSIGSGFIYKAYAMLNDGTKVDDVSTISDLNSVNKYCYYLITNRHVVEDSSEIKVYIGEFDKYIDAQVCGYDNKIDVAVVYFEYCDYYRPCVIADSSTVETGDFVIALGNPEGLEYYDSATLGIVSSPERYYSEDTDNDNVNDWDQVYIQHDCAINPGNSGGPLFNLKGEVIAINTMKFSSVDIDNMGFSIPSNNFMTVVPLLEKGETIERPLLGVSIIQVKNALSGNKIYISNTEYIDLPTGLNYGLYISEVTQGGTAQKAGVQVGDIILSFDGVDLLEGYQVRVVLAKYIIGSGEKAVLEVYRNNKVIKLEVTF